MKLVKAKDLKVGDVLVLPFNRTATISILTVGRRYVTYKTEYGNSRTELDYEHWVNRPE